MAIGANVAIWLAYFLIPYLGWWLLRRKPSLAPDQKIARWCLLFVLLCGLTHLLDAVMFWWAGYNLNTVGRVATAVVSWVTVYLLWSSRYRLLGYVPPEEHARVVSEKETAVAAAAAAIAARERALRAEEAALAARDTEHRLRVAATERRERQVAEAQRLHEEMRDDLAVMAGRRLTDEEYQRLRKRLHDLVGTVR